MSNIDNICDLQLTEERADMDSMDLALEQFFSNVLECIDFEEEKISVLNCIH